MFKRRDGTSGISGHLYESKLISLLYFRGIHENAIKEFQLASNVDNIGAFDDICFKAVVEGFDKPICVFIQAKHKEKKTQALTIALSTYLESYLKIRQQFNTSSEDLFFKGTYEEAACLFVIYTTAKDEFRAEPKVENSFCSFLNDLIGTGGTAKQPYNQEENVKFLCKEAMIKQMTFLAERVAKHIIDDNFEMLLNDQTVLRFHVILAREVVNVSEIQADEYRLATFRHNFFDTCDEYLTIFKDALFTEIIKNRKILETKNGKGKEKGKKKGKIKEEETDTEKEKRKEAEKEKQKQKEKGKIKEEETDTEKEKRKEAEKEKQEQKEKENRLIDDFCTEPTNAKKLSELIGTVIAYNKGSLQFSKEYLANCRPEFKQVSVSQMTINQAVELAAKQILSSPKLRMRVPLAFGNKDITLRCSDEKKTNRIELLASFITDLLDKHKSDKIVNIDESIRKGLLKLNGGIAGALGNLFVLDDNTKRIKITDNSESLGPLAKQLYDRLDDEIKSRNNTRETNDKILNLSEYEFSFKGNKFPTLLLGCGEYEENLARDFLGKLVIYSNQANESEVEEILKDEIEESLTLSESLQAKIEDMFLKYHNEIQLWWKLTKQAPYLTKTSQIFEKATCCIIDDPVLSSISVPYVTKIKQYSYRFNEDAVKSLNLQNHVSTIIVAKMSMLTIVKVMQHLKNNDLIALDLQYIVSLPTKKRNALRRELLMTNTNKEKVIMFVCDKIHNSRKDIKTLENVAEALRNKKTIIIANHLSLEILQRYFYTADTVHDERNGILDMSEESQTSIFKSARVNILGIEVGLEDLAKGWISYTRRLKKAS